MPGTRAGMTTTRSEQETHRAQRPEFLGVEDGAAFGDLEPAIGAPQLVAIAPDELARWLVAAIAEDVEIGRDRDRITLDSGDAHVGEETARVRGRIFGVAVGVFEPNDAFAQAHNIIGDDEERVAMIAVGLVVGR